MIKNTSTPQARKIWDNVKRAADSVPEHLREHIGKLVRESRKKQK